MSTTSTSGITSGATATDRGTKILKTDGGLDKSAFLKILTSELSNQDPTQQKDSTQYIAQLAQFSSLEQLSNLNSTLSFSGATSLIGKTAFFNSTDSQGNPNYGTVVGTTRSGDSITLSVQVTQNGTTSIKEFNYSDVTNVTA